MNYFGLVVAGLILWAPIAQGEIRFGIEPRLSPEETRRAFGPLIQYLAREIGEPIHLEVPENFAGFGKGVESRRYDLIFAAPATILNHAATFEDQLNWLAVAVDRKQGASLRGLLIVKKESPFRQVGDLRGKRIAFVDRSSQGYLLLSQFLREAGMDPERDIDARFYRRLDLTMRALLDGQADAAGVGDVVLTRFRDEIDRSLVHVLASTAAVPNWTVVGLDQELSRRVSKALLALTAGSPIAGSALGTSHFGAFQEAKPHELEPIRRAVREKTGHGYPK